MQCNREHHHRQKPHSIYSPHRLLLFLHPFSTLSLPFLFPFTTLSLPLATLSLLFCYPFSTPRYPFATLSLPFRPLLHTNNNTKKKPNPYRIRLKREYLLHYLFTQYFSLNSHQAVLLLAHTLLIRHMGMQFTDNRPIRYNLGNHTIHRHVQQHTPFAQPLPLHKHSFSAHYRVISAKLQTRLTHLWSIQESQLPHPNMH